MKRFTYLLFLLSVFAFGQNNPKLETFKMYSQNVKDSIDVKVWLPFDYDKTSEKYPVLFECVYDHTNFLAATFANIWNSPKTIVVFANIEAGNEHYSSPQLTEKGQQYYAFIKDELFQNLKKKYRTSDYKIATGLSQGGDYLGYILRNNPNLFNSYLFFSTERPIFYKPDFKSYSAKIEQPISVFIATSSDAEERIKFANELNDSLKINPKINIKKEHYPNSEHSYSILYAFPDALNFAYKDYVEYLERKTGETLVDFYNYCIREKREKYGNLNYNQLIFRLSSKINKNDSEKDLSELLDIVSKDEQSFDIDFFNLGYNIYQFEFYTIAEKAYQIALQKAETKENRMDKSSIYRYLSRVYDKQNNKEKALSTLQNAYEKLKTKDEDLLFDIGKYYIDSKINPKKGIETLNSLITEKHKTRFPRSKDQIFTEIAKGYFALNNKKSGLQYLEKALEFNANFEEALKLKGKLGK